MPIFREVGEREIPESLKPYIEQIKAARPGLIYEAELTPNENMRVVRGNLRKAAGLVRRTVRFVEYPKPPKGIVRFQVFNLTENQ